MRRHDVAWATRTGVLSAALWSVGSNPGPDVLFVFSYKKRAIYSFRRFELGSHCVALIVLEIALYSPGWP